MRHRSAQKYTGRGRGEVDEGLGWVSVVKGRVFRV